MATKWRIQTNRKDDNQKTWKETVVPAVSSSTGSADAGAVPLLGEDGKLDPSVLPETSGGTVDAAQVTFQSARYPTVSAALTAVLYEAPLITSFTNDIGITEIGASVPSVTLSWALNKQMTSLSLNGVSLDPSALSHVVTGPFTFDTSWTLYASDGQNATSATTSLLFQRRRYWGVSPNATASNTEILNFTSDLSTNDQKTVTYDCSGGVYPYFCYPASWGVLTKVTVNGFGFSAYSVISQTVTNAHGHNDTYYIVRFNYKQNGNNLKVSWQ